MSQGQVPPSIPQQPRSAESVIDQAISESKRWESICIGLLVCLGIVGIVVLIVGAFRDNGVLALSGAAAGAILWPALRYAKSFRVDNIAIRMSEIPLSKAKTAKEAATILSEILVMWKGRA